MLERFLVSILALLSCWTMLLLNRQHPDEKLTLTFVFLTLLLPVPVVWITDLRTNARTALRAMIVIGYLGTLTALLLRRAPTIY
jgi:hypothetical protein